MTSPRPESVAADANVLLAAAVGGAAQRIFNETGLSVVTTEDVLRDVRAYLARLASHYGMPKEDAARALRNLPLRAYPESSYRSHLAEAKRYLQGRDLDDAGLAALAMKLKIPVWSNDKDFRVVPVELFPTARLLRTFGI